MKKCLLAMCALAVSGIVHAGSTAAYDTIESGSEPDVAFDSVISDDEALKMTVLRGPGGAVVALIVTDLVSEERFVFGAETMGEVSATNEGKKPRSGDSSLMDESDGGGDVPDDATLEFMGCSGSVCTYGVWVDGQNIGTLVVDDSGPQPKATLIPN